MKEELKHLEDNRESQAGKTTRRDFFRISAYAATAAAISSLLGGCKKKEKPQSAPANIEKPRLVERGNLPESTITDEPVPLKKPEEIMLSDEEYKKASKELAEKIFKLKDSLKAELEKSGADNYDLIKRFVVSAYDMAYQNPAFKAYLDKHQPKDINEFVQRSDALQPLLLAGGYYFCAERTGELNQQTGVIREVSDITMAKVTGTKLLKYKDDHGTKDVPLYILGDPSYTTVTHQALARYLSRPDATVVFKEKVKANFYKRLREMANKGFEVTGVDLKKLRDEYMNETLIHEGTHAYLADRYPKSGESAMENMYLWPLMLQLENGKRAAISRFQHPVQMQELCAVGNELYHSNAPYPLSLTMYLTINVGNNPVHGYRLVSKALPLLVMKYAKGLEKQRILDSISQNRGVETFDFVRLALKMNDKQKQAVGRELYELGLHMMKILESGQMRQVKIPKRVIGR